MDRTRSQARDRGNDQDRRREQDRALDRVRDQAKIRQLANQWRAMEQANKEWSHAFARHRDITEEQLARRAASGELPNGEKKAVPRHATKWRSDPAMVVAADGLVHSGDYRRALAFAEANGQDRIKVARPLSEVLGPDWREDVYGRSAASGGVLASRWNDGSTAVGRWQRQGDGRWQPVTCFPEPGE
ncbi:MAG: hypothetical protein ACRDPY_30295 [Streptosporangiaceae bacterium]